jgi:hypothetical protein
LCSTGVEEIDHILLSCAFSQQVWHTALGVLSFAQVVFTAADTFWSWWLRSRKLVTKNLRRGFDSLIFLVGWQFWKERNSRTFNNASSSTGEVLEAIVEEANQWDFGGLQAFAQLNGDS